MAEPVVHRCEFRKINLVKEESKADQKTPTASSVEQVRILKKSFITITILC